MDAATDKDLPLKEDTRLLGRLLGDVLRAQTGAAGFERIEAIRQTAIRFRRASGDEAVNVKLELDALLNGLPIAQALEVVRAFSYFSHLVNIAEDVHQNRRRRAYAQAGAPPQAGSMARALERAAQRGSDGASLARWFAAALVSPVLTAHPTEVQRRSILDCEREIVRLLQWRDRVVLTPDEAEDFETGLYRQVLALWQTAMLRLSKLRVSDEIDNGLAFYRYTFLSEIPRIYAALEKCLREEFAMGPDMRLPAFLRMGSWIGGDRDGNPNVVGETLANAIGAQATLVFTHYLEQVNLLGAELSLSSRLVTPTPELMALADCRPRYQPASQGRAVSAGAGRRVFARRGDGARTGGRSADDAQPQAALALYASPAELLADLETIRASLASHGAQLLAAGRLEPLIRAVEVFGFHLAVLDLRQNADVHEQVVGELLARAGVVSDYDRLPEDGSRRAAHTRAGRSTIALLAASGLFATNGI